MSLQHPEQRSRTGTERQTEVLAGPAPEPATLFESAWRDYIFAEVWTRPGLDLRSRYFIAITGAACEGGREDVIDGYIRGALSSGEVSQTELREAALHIAVYGGWSAGAALDAALSRVEKAMGLPPVAVEPIRAEPWDPEKRLEKGAASFTNTMHFPAPPPATPYFEGGILNFVFGEMWERPGLDQRARRWVTLVGVSESRCRTPIRTHIYAAMKSGNASLEEMQEFVLQYAVHGGWPTASVIQAAVFDMAKLVAEGLPYQD